MKEINLFEGKNSVEKYFDNREESQENMKPKKCFVIYKKHGIISQPTQLTVKRSMKEEELSFNNVHLCADSCPMKLWLNCSKVADKEKKDISEYLFIRDGYEVIDEDGEIKYLYVQGCQALERYELLCREKGITNENERLNHQEFVLHKSNLRALADSESDIELYEEKEPNVNAYQYTKTPRLYKKR